MPVQDDPARVAAEHRIMISDRALSVLPVTSGTTDTMTILRVVDATGRLLEERTWNGSTTVEFESLPSGTYVLIAQALDGAPRATRFLIP